MKRSESIPGFNMYIYSKLIEKDRSIVATKTFCHSSPSGGQFYGYFETRGDATESATECVKIKQ